MNYKEEQLKKIAEDLESKIKGLDSSGLSEEIQGQVKKLKCHATEWQSPAFLVIVVGPVKSGKSTFVNLLAHEKVSPTDFLECTVRPSIISKRKEGDVSMITPYVTTGNPTMENVDSIINHIKVDSDLIKVEKRSPCELNDDNLAEKVACRIGIDLGLNDEVVLTSITAKGGEFLQKDIYLIDMPGFDGVHANLDKGFYKAIVDRADLVVFIQSSNSAINKVSEDLCSMIQKRNGKVPIFFVHNKFDSAYWQEDSEREKVEKEHVGDARKFFNDKNLTIKKDYSINLEKVKDAVECECGSGRCKPQYKVMLNDEKECFVDMEKKFHEEITASQDETRLQNFLNRTINEAKELKAKLDERRNTLLNEDENYENTKQRFELFANELGEGEDFYVFEDKDKQDLISKLKDVQTKFCNNINDDDDKYNTKETREKARNLIREYKCVTEDFINEKFEPNGLQTRISKSYMQFFKSKIPQELFQWKDSLSQDIRFENTPSFEIDYSNIDEAYNVDKKIEKLFIKTRRGNEVVELMKDIEQTLFGLIQENPHGYIPKDFFPDTQKKIEEWIQEIKKHYKDAYIKKVNQVKEDALKEIIPDKAKHDAEEKQIGQLIQGIEGIMKQYQGY